MPVRASHALLSVSAAALLMLGLASSVFAANDQDRKFLRDEVRDNALETTLGGTAMTHGSDPLVKAFGRRMVLDHTRALRESLAFSDALGVPPPATFTPEQQQIIDWLSTLQGQQFDTAYMDYMVAEHAGDVNQRLPEEVASGGDSGLKQWTAGLDLLITEHLRLAVSVRDRIPRVIETGIKPVGGVPSNIGPIPVTPETIVGDFGPLCAEIAAPMTPPTGLWTGLQDYTRMACAEAEAAPPTNGGATENATPPGGGARTEMPNSGEATGTETSGATQDNGGMPNDNGGDQGDTNDNGAP